MPAPVLRSTIDDGGELALLDVREELMFSRAHLLHACSAPLSRLELIVPRLVPRRATRIVLLDDDDGLAQRAARVLARHGYTCLFILDGGVSAWARAGFVLFSGMHVPSKAFGEIVEHQAGTPSIEATELKRRLDHGDDLIVIDSRPFDEFTRISIPGAVDVPGAELMLRVPELVAASTTTVVVNCAGRTRSIIGAQSLINAGLPNKVVALRNGTMGWTLAGFAPDHGSARRHAPGTPPLATLTWAKAAAARIGARCGIEHIDLDTLQRWRNESSVRTLYVFDVRDPREYEAGHLPGAISAPGGQLVQATDLFIGASHARIVLVDDLECRAMMTGAWLHQMGWDDVHVLVAAGHETGWPKPLVLGFAERPTDQIDAERLTAVLADTAATVIDLSPSRDYRRGHIPGAWFAIRARLDRALTKIDAPGTIVLTSEDGILAALALDEAASLTARPVRYLGGGNAAWVASGRALANDRPRLADEPIDAWLKPYERDSGNTAAMNEYLSWEIDLPQRIEQDGTCRFRPLLP